jgi:Zn-dependent peptidase ImmA (M78 family)
MQGLRDKVKALLEQHKVENAPIPIQEIAEFFMPVIKYNFPDHISGTIINEEDFTVIGVNAQQAKVRQRFTIAHELGHYLLGHDHTRMIDEKFDAPDHKEKDANQFASELLMPFIFLEKDVKKSPVSLQSLASKYEVSEQAMSIRLLETGLINQMKI